MSGDSASGTPDLGYEVLKLLLQVAWADGEIADREIATLTSHASTLGLSAPQFGQIAACLAGTQPLPAPNLAMLREHRVVVLRLVKEMMQSDGDVGLDEEELLTEISTLLR